LKSLTLSAYFIDLSEVSSTGAYGFMKTSSTKAFEKQPPAEKWQSLYKMFKEWRFQKELAEAQKLASKGEGGPPASEAAVVLLNEEKTKLRQAIYSLNQRKQLSNADAKLLEVLQQKLKALNNIR